MRPFVRRYLPPVGVFLFISMLGAAALGEPSPGDVREARELFASAVQLEGAGNYTLAAQKLRAAVEIKETPGLRYHLAHCEEQLGSFVAAAADYERVAELIRNGAAAPDVEPLLPAALERVDAHVAKLEILVPAGVPAVAELDGAELPKAVFMRPLSVEAGQHRLRVVSEGHPEFAADLSFSRGERRTVRVLFDAAAAPAPALASSTAPRAEPVAEHGSHSQFGARGAVLVGEAALVATGVGLGLGFMVLRSHAADRVEQSQGAVDQASDSDGACLMAPVPAACGELEDAIAAHDRYTKWMAASFVGAGVATGALVVTWVLWPGSPRGVTLGVHPQAAGLRLLAGGSF